MSEKERYEAVASTKRTDFIIKIVLFAILIAGALCVMIFMMDNITALLAGTVCVIWFGFSLFRVVKESYPRYLFCSELEGKIVKIVNLPTEYSRISGKAKPRVAEVYIAKSKDEVRLIAPLTPEAAACYQVGDRVLHIKGTRAPIILEREVAVTPCPICARPRTNRPGTKCPHCGA